MNRFDQTRTCLDNKVIRMEFFPHFDNEEHTPSFKYGENGYDRSFFIKDGGMHFWVGHGEIQHPFPFGCTVNIQPPLRYLDEKSIKREMLYILIDAANEAQKITDHTTFDASSSWYMFTLCQKSLPYQYMFDFENQIGSMQEMLNTPYFRIYDDILSMLDLYLLYSEEPIIINFKDVDYNRKALHSSGARMIGVVPETRDEALEFTQKWGVPFIKT